MVAKYPHLCTAKNLHQKMIFTLNTKCTQDATAVASLQADLQSKFDQKSKNKEDALGKFLTQIVPGTKDTVMNTIDIDKTIEDIVNVKSVNEIVNELQKIREIYVENYNLDGITQDMAVDVVSEAFQKRATPPLNWTARSRILRARSK